VSIVKDFHDIINNIIRVGAEIKISKIIEATESENVTQGEMNFEQTLDLEADFDF
jgi:hypothetical protein